jgi:peptidoglycan/LPS O-acetylase OafA/YrhL
VNATTCLLVGLAIPLFAEVRSHWLGSVAHQIAKYSYGIYLLHIPSLALMFNHFPSLPLPLKIGGFISLCGVTSVVTYHLIENPLIQVGRSIAEKVG